MNIVTMVRKNTVFLQVTQSKGSLAFFSALVWLRLKKQNTIAQRYFSSRISRDKNPAFRIARVQYHVHVRVNHRVSE